MTKTINRPASTDSLSQTKRSEIVSLFIAGQTDYAEIASATKTSVKAVSKVINEDYKRFSDLKETKHLIESQHYPDITKSASYHQLKLMAKAKEMNSSFIEKISEESEALTDSEVMFALHYVSTGNPTAAIEEAKLDVGLISTGTSANIAKALRADLLLHKPNVVHYITDLKTKRYLPEAVSKSQIQVLLLEQIESVTKDPHLKPQSRHSLKHKLTESLGRTIGAFSDRVQVTTVNPVEALAQLEKLNAASEACAPKTIIDVKAEPIDE